MHFLDVRIKYWARFYFLTGPVRTAYSPESSNQVHAERQNWILRLCKYSQNRSSFWPITKCPNNQQPYEIGGCPRVDIEAIGLNLVYYKGEAERFEQVLAPAHLLFVLEHTGGGHFPALDSPSEFVEDMREFFDQHWA